MPYGHATVLNGEPTPLQELRACVHELGAWARLNPNLENLYRRLHNVTIELERQANALRDRMGKGQA